MLNFEQKVEILNRIGNSEIGLLGIKFRKSLDWYAHLDNTGFQWISSDGWIGGSGNLYENGSCPQEAVLNLWDRIVNYYATGNNYLSVYDSKKKISKLYQYNDASQSFDYKFDICWKKLNKVLKRTTEELAKDI